MIGLDRRRFGWLSALLVVGCASAPGRTLVREVRPASVARCDGDETCPQRRAPLEATPSPSPGAVADRVHLRCRDHDDSCSDAIGMLVRAEDETRPLEETLRCTASLIAPDRVLTASHCLLPSERHPGSACASEWIAFPARDGRPMEWVACAAVEHADAVDEERVMRSDVAILRLHHAVDRPILALDLEPPAEGSIVTVVAVRPHPIYPSQHEVAGRRCRVATRASAVDTFGHEAARVGWLMDCPSYPGNSGSPVLDGRGRLRAIMHAGSAPGQGVGITSTLPR